MSTNHTKMIEELRAPFPPESVKFRPGQVRGDRCMALAYIDSRDVQDRLDDVFGLSWQCSIVEDNERRIICRISCLIDGVWTHREGTSYGAVPMTKVRKGETLDTTDDEREMAAKGAESDAFKRAASRWGIGAYLHNLPTMEARFDKGSWSMARGEEERLRREYLTPSKPRTTEPRVTLSDGQQDLMKRARVLSEKAHPDAFKKNVRQACKETNYDSLNNLIKGDESKARAYIEEWEAELEKARGEAVAV